MSATVKILWGLLFLSLTFGAVALSTLGIPVPFAEITKQLPLSQFIKKE